MPESIEQSRVQSFGSLEFIARQVVEGFITGLHKSPFHGFSVEFAEHRQYNVGESVKNIDWKLYGRTDRFYSKRYEEETNLRCQIIIDNSSSMYYPVKKNISVDDEYFRLFKSKNVVVVPMIKTVDIWNVDDFEEYDEKVTKFMQSDAFWEFARKYDLGV